jgi:hypothetical protein
MNDKRGLKINKKDGFSDQIKKKELYEFLSTNRSYVLFFKHLAVFLKNGNFYFSRIYVDTTKVVNAKYLGVFVYAHKKAIFYGADGEIWYFKIETI